MGKKLPSYLLDKYQLIGTVTFSVLFALIFLLLYVPFSDTAWFSLGSSPYFLHTLSFSIISILIICFSRVLMYRLKKFFQMTYTGFVLWSIAEVVLICIIYTVLTVELEADKGMPVWSVFLKALLCGTLGLIIPYIISGMFFAIVDKNRTIRLMRSNNVISDEARRRDNKITLFDNHGALKLSVSTSNLYYIESDDNYIKVWYTDNKGELKTYMLRYRLKTVEESFRDGPLVRCHRKYIVNLEKVRVCRKESDGYWLDLDNERITPIQVSKTYLENILARISQDTQQEKPRETS